MIDLPGSAVKDLRSNINAPLWDINTFYGRLRHYFFITDYRYCLVPTKRLYFAREQIEQCSNGSLPDSVTDKELRHSKKLYESAFHPDSGELQNVIGRMSFQVPGGMLITAAMLQFYKTNIAVVFWQWINQSFNALVNYTNRNAASDVTTRQVMVSYATATTSALVTALSFKYYFQRTGGTLVQRFVPFLAVAAANMVNIPLSRQSEIQDGVACFDEHNNKIANSKYAAVQGISQVVFSRITIAAPGMLIMPFIMEALEKKPWFMKYQRFHIVFQTLMVGTFLTVMVPVGCAVFPQRSSITVDKLKLLDGAEYERIRTVHHEKIPTVLYFNKGL